MMEEVNEKRIYELAYEFKHRYPTTIAWRLQKNSDIVEKFLNPGEKVQYVFVAQKSESVFNILSSCVVALTDQRIMIGRKRVVFGYFFTSITPDMFNDLKVHSSIVWGRVKIDTIKEEVILTNIAKSAMPEVKTAISTYIIEQKKKYPKSTKKAF